MTILVILASFAVLQLRGVGESARINQARIQIGLFDEALATYEAGVGSYPSSLEALIACPPDADPNKWDGPYLKGGVIPLDPWNQPYQYVYPGHTGTSPDIWTTGPRGQIGNWIQ